MGGRHSPPRPSRRSPERRGQGAIGPLARINPALAVAAGSGVALEVRDPPGVVGTGVVGAGVDVPGAGEVGVGGGVLMVGVGVGVGLVEGVGEPLGEPGVEGAGAGEDGAGRVVDTEGCGVAAACATTALPPLVPALRVAPSGLCRGGTLGAVLRDAAGGATAGELAPACPGSVASVQVMNPIAARPVAASAPRAGRLARPGARREPRGRGRPPRGGVRVQSGGAAAGAGSGGPAPATAAPASTAPGTASGAAARSGRLSTSGLDRSTRRYSACSATSQADGGRAAGSLRVRSATSAATSGGTYGGSAGRPRSRCARATARASPANGTCPVRHWCATTPSAYRSPAGVAEAPETRSGDR